MSDSGRASNKTNGLRPYDSYVVRAKKKYTCAMHTVHILFGNGISKDKLYIELSENFVRIL